MIGTSLSHYEILDKLGEGGMGEVYRARDGKLGREVAIKVLPEIFAQAPERLARFQREAQLLASLNHPNIAAIHGLEESEGKHYLVLELVPGETLADRVKGGPIPLKEAIALARQIAKALDAAHEKGVIHRDLKPANVKITPDGDIKVLDFGLAKAFTEDESTPEPASSLSPTMSAGATRAGMILGTAAYMSPEQARGKQVDKRTDIFSFGVVLYEMLTGQKLFDGEEVSDILASVLKTEPDWEALPSDVTPRLRELLERCLEKDRKRRWRDVGDVELELERALTPPTVEIQIHKENARPTWAALALVALVAGVLGGALVWLGRPAAPPPRASFAHVLPDGERFSFAGRRTIAVSPSGSHVVYVANGRLNLRAVDSLEATPLAGTEGSRAPVFSPDGQWIAFWAGSLKKIALSGGAPIELCPADNPFGVSWAHDGRILFGQGARGIFAVSENGGEPEALVTLGSSESAYGPVLLPSGRTLLFALTSEDAAWDQAEIVAQDLQTGSRSVLLRGGSDVRYLETGHLLYSFGNEVFAVPFDPETVSVAGTPSSVLEGVTRASAITPATHYDVSTTGTLAYVPGETTFEGFTLNLLNRSGSGELLTSRRGRFSYPRLSHDGQRLAVMLTEGGESHIWVLDRRDGRFSRLTGAQSRDNLNAVWSPDSRWIAFRATQTTGSQLYRTRSDFSGASELLLESEDFLTPQAWSRDGEWLLYFTLGPDGASELWALPMRSQEGPREPRLIMSQTGFSTVRLSASLSPDARFLTYAAEDTGQSEVYVQPFPGPGQRWKVSTDEGGEDPVWSQDGSEIFYRYDHQLLAVAVQRTPEFVPGTPRVLFESPRMNPGSVTRQYDVTPEGDGFVVIREPELSGIGREQINVVTNWLEELERLVPRP